MMNSQMKPQFSNEPIRQAPMTPGARAIMEARNRRALSQQQPIRQPPQAPPVGNMLPGKPRLQAAPPIRQTPVGPGSRQGLAPPMAYGMDAVREKKQINPAY